ncbi:MAG: MFS transporter [Rhizomicrobium sp.]
MSPRCSWATDSSFYDFLTFSYFSAYIGRTFFPSDDPMTSLLASLATFGVGFLTRPLGAIVIGPMADRIGRKPTMIFTFVLMGFAITGLSLTPSYASIGVAAPVLVIMFRLVQGFALGGEVGPSTAYMVELVPPERRGFFLGMQYATQDGATLLAGLVGVVLASLLNDAQLQAWGWRVALLIGASIVPFGLWLRRTLPETLSNAGNTKSEAVVASRVLYRGYGVVIVLGLLMFAAGTVGSYTINYMTTYALTTLKFSAAIAFGVTIINGAFSILSEVTSGFLCDRFGRKLVMLIPAALLVLSILPGFWLIAQYHNLWVLYGTEIVMVTFAGIAQVPVIAGVTESLPASIRSGAVATVYAVAISLFGGTTQFVVTALIKWTHDPLAPAYYWSAAAVVGVIAMALFKESAPVKLAPGKS